MDIKELPIGKIGLSVRATNALYKAGVRTAGDLLPYTAETLADIRNLGTKSIDEILQKIAELNGAKNLESVVAASFSQETGYPVPENYEEWVLDETGRGFVCAYLKEKAIPVDALELLSARAYNLLVLNGYRDLHQVVFRTEQELMQMPGVDATVANEILRQCSHYLRSNRDVILSALEEANRS